MTPPIGYEFISTIAENQTTIWLAKSIEAQKEVVIKTLNLKQVEEWKGFELFEREIATLKQLDHPAIPKFIDLVKDEQEGALRWHIVQEKVTGDTIRTLLERETVFNETELISIATQILDILIYLQDFSPPLFHRDIKPGNLIVTDNKVFLIDFGSVRYVVPRAIGGSTIVGTNGYMAPEQLMGRADMSSDLFGLGMTLIHLVTGKHPDDLPMKRMKILWKEDARIKLGDGFTKVLNRLSEPDPTKRFLNAVDARAAIDKQEFGLAPKELTIGIDGMNDLIEDFPKNSEIEFVRVGSETIVKRKVKLPAWNVIWIPLLGLFFFALFLMNAYPILASILVAISAIGLGSLVAYLNTTQAEVRFSLTVADNKLVVKYGLERQCIPFDEILVLNTEMKILNKKEIKLPLTINKLEFTPPLPYIERRAIIDRMQLMVQHEQKNLKTESAKER